MTTTPPTLRFGFAPRAAAPAVAPASTATPAASPAAAPVAAAPVAQPTMTSTAPVQETAAVAQAVQPVQADAGAAGDASLVPAVATEEITIMLPIGGRQGQVFGGVFGRMEGDKFRTDPLLKSIYLLELIDGAVPGGAAGESEHSEMLEQMGGIPETITVSVPSELAAAFKATLANLSGARWQQLYDQAGAMANSMVKFALNNEARIARETVAQIARTGGELFTVQVAEPKELRFMMVSSDDYDDYDDYDRELSGVPQAVAGSPVVTAAAGEAADAAVGMEAFASACGGRQEGDTVSYNHIELFTVVADSAENAVKVQALVPESLMVRTAISASDVMVNGQPYVVAGPLLEDDSSTVDVPR
ncbi:hypothetical protein [Variovorax sp. RA8]|uniref:hypothetical protein n=1 Tax=Variovorax sp. (strain JCM 16519 / RA8) TaxID=662548 RepID=UPI0013179D89|nr:hypothetical protein [Variovorax sp. RA8]VTU45001.1 hypothetical protein RA8P2_00437 [Variovorax sp. RA8]